MSAEIKVDAYSELFALTNVSLHFVGARTHCKVFKIELVRLYLSNSSSLNFCKGPSLGYCMTVSLYAGILIFGIFELRICSDRFEAALCLSTS